MKLQLSILLLASLTLRVANAQVSIHTNSIVNAQGTLSTNANITNESAGTNVTDAQLTVSGMAQTIRTVPPLTLSMLKIIEGGTKTLSGSWEVTNSLQLVKGILRVTDNAKLFYSGETPSEGNEFSFVEGFLFQQGSGRKYFPLGVTGIYTPLVLEDVPTGTPQTGIRAVSGPPQFSLPDQLSFGTPHYWQMNNVVASTVSLSLNDVSDLNDATELTILQADTETGNAGSLEATRNATFITSTQPIQQPFLAIGRKGEFELIIHDMITPFIRDNINDKLFIENIERTISNEVKLFDRWGELVESWTDYTNDAAYDFSALSPGNYVCLVDFVFPGDTRTNKAKGMITILKSK